MATISIKEAHEFIRMQIKKNKLGFVSPEDIDRALNRAVSDWMSAVVYKYKRTGKYSYDHLLVKRGTFTVTPSTGTQSLSVGAPDYTEALTIYITYDGLQIEGTLYSWDEYLEVKNSKIVTPDTSYPAGTIYIDSSGTPKIEFSPVPATGSYVYTLVYMRRPATASYKYTVTSSGNIAYNPTGSVDIDLDDRYFSDILTRALMYLGIALSDSDTASTEQLKDNNQRVDER